MDAPPIHYARTEDGVNIAYYDVGQGPVSSGAVRLFALVWPASDEAGRAV